MGSFWFSKMKAVVVRELKREVKMGLNCDLNL